MHPALQHRQHRPWPIPAGPWVGRQSWCDLLFAHWTVPVETLRALVPEPLRVQAHEGTGWVGLVPFRMRDVMLRGLPALPWVSSFPELNLRTYVEHEGKPGVWFFSLDATNPLAVRAARRFAHLPYHRAHIAMLRDGEGCAYACRRADGAVELQAAYAPTSEPYTARAGTLEHFLTERYCLYARSRRGALYRIDVHHAPWPLQRAQAEIRVNTVGAPHGIALAGAPSLLHFARRVDVVTWLPARL